MKKLNNQTKISKLPKMDYKGRFNLLAKRKYFYSKPNKMSFHFQTKRKRIQYNKNLL